MYIIIIILFFITAIYYNNNIIINCYGQKKESDVTMHTHTRTHACTHTQGAGWTYLGSVWGGQAYPWVLQPYQEVNEKDWPENTGNNNNSKKKSECLLRLF